MKGGSWTGGGKARRNLILIVEWMIMEDKYSAWFNELLCHVGLLFFVTLVCLINVVVEAMIVLISAASTLSNDLVRNKWIKNLNSYLMWSWIRSWLAEAGFGKGWWSCSGTALVNCLSHGKLMSNVCLQYLHIPSAICSSDCKWKAILPLAHPDEWVLLFYLHI